MGNEAWEKAVEAGARAKAGINGGCWDNLPAHWRAVYLTETDVALRAAFPVMVEVVLDVASAYVKEQYGPRFLEHPIDRERIRTRIEAPVG